VTRPSSAGQERPSPLRALRSVVAHPIEWACGLLMAVLTAIVFAQVITRYVLAYPWEWPEEFARILFVWLALLGAVLAFRKGGHFSIEAFVGLFPPPMRRGIAALLHITLLGFLLLVAYLGLEATLRVRDQLTTATEISMSYGYAAVPVSFALMAMEMARLLWRDLLGVSR
jgi:TRAP-type C4-dicarboxylate transport system permease small subunit